MRPYNIRVYVEDPKTKAAVEVKYPGVRRTEAMQQPVLASAILLLEQADNAKPDDRASLGIRFDEEGPEQ